ncbi:MAG: hypothetical protein RIQ41_164 [Candidatus Parcubacteria bacterium]|jgi:hypothetical protein
MKKALALLFLTITLYISQVTPTYAVFVICGNCATVVTQLKDSIVQGFQLVKETLSEYSNAITAYNQQLETVNNTILIPMRDAMSLIVLMQSGDAIKNLILGSLGSEALLVKDPAQYFKRQALNSVAVGLGDAAAYKKMYGGSMMQYLINSSKYSYANSSTKIASISQSSVPSMVQKNACDDVMLTQLAMEDTAVEGEPLDQVKFKERKQYFYDQFCKRDPSNDANTAQSLEILQKARPAIAGWGGFLAVTSGDNPYNKATNIQLVLNQDAQAAVDQAKADLLAGGGIKSMTKCTKYAENDINGNLYEETATPACAVQEIQQLSSVLASSFREVVETPMKLIRESFGTGAGSLISTAFNTVNLLQSISSSIDTIAGKGSSGSATVPDFKNNTVAKESIATPIRDALDLQGKNLTSIEAVHPRLLNEIGRMQTVTTGITYCYQALVKDNIISSGGPEISQATTYVTAKEKNLTTLKTAISQDETRIAEGRAIIADFRTKIDAATSSKDLQILFTDYQTKIKSGKIPGQEILSARENNYVTLQGDISLETVEGGTAYNLKLKCDDLRQAWLRSQTVP